MRPGGASSTSCGASSISSPATPARQLAGFVWFERTDSDFMLSKEFDHLRAEESTRSRQRGEVRRAAPSYQAKVAASGVSANIQAMVRQYFDELGAAMRSTRAGSPGRRAAPPRKPGRLRRARLSPAAGASRTAGAARVLRHPPRRRPEPRGRRPRYAAASVLMSPPVLLSRRHDRSRGAEAAAEFQSSAPLTRTYALASRLSYFLWSSMPDAEPLAQAGRGRRPPPPRRAPRTRSRRMLQ